MKCDKVFLLGMAVLIQSACQSTWASDAAAELAALKAKYPEVLERCTVFEMMKKAEEFQKIDVAQRETVKAKDWEGFERVARAGISLNNAPCRRYMV